jgi:TolA-binding protein
MPVCAPLHRIGFPRRWTLTLVGVSALGLASGAQAQTLGAVEQRLDRLENVTRDIQRQADRSSRSSSSRDDVYLQLDRRLGALERTISNLVSAQERDHRELTATVEQLRRMKSDVEARFDIVENQAQPAPPEQSAGLIAKTPAPPLDDDARYSQAMGYADQQDWLKAELAFDTFITSYPSDSKIPEARYQLGRAFAGQGKYAQAAQMFLDLYQDHPDAPFVVANLFALGEALIAIGPENTEQACDVYSEIEVTHGSNLSVEQRSQLLDQRLSLECSN